VKLLSSGGVKHATKTPATDLAATATRLRLLELELRALEASEYAGEYGTRSGVLRSPELGFRRPYAWFGLFIERERERERKRVKWYRQVGEKLRYLESRGEGRL
jgi:hypothetical protein